jgi:hypothetical protein
MLDESEWVRILNGVEFGAGEDAVVLAEPVTKTVSH